MSINDALESLGSWAALVATIVGTIFVWIKWRSEIIWVKPSVLAELQEMAANNETRAQTILARLDREREQRRKLEEELHAYKTGCEGRITDIIHDYEKQLATMRVLLDEATKRIRELELINNGKG